MLALPFPAGSFDIVTTGYGLRNVPDLRAAIDEIHRVLRAGGQALSLDFNRPANPVVRAVYLAYLTVVGRPARLGAAPRSGHVSLYPGVDPQLSRRRRRRAAVRGRGFVDVRVQAGARRPDGHSLPQGRRDIAWTSTRRMVGRGHVHAAADRPPGETRRPDARPRRGRSGEPFGSRLQLHQQRGIRRRSRPRPGRSRSSGSACFRVHGRSVPEAGRAWARDARWRRSPRSARPTTPTTGCCSTCGPNGSSRLTRPGVTSWSSWSGCTRRAPPGVPNDPVPSCRYAHSQ